LALWWLYGAVGTYALGTQVEGSRRTWLLVGIFLGPIGMLAALLIPAFQGRTPKTSRTRCTAFGLSFGLLVFSEVMLRSVSFGSAFYSALAR
jgi:hypothetical protein